MTIESGRTHWKSVALLLVIASLSMYSLGVPQRLAAQFIQSDFVEILGFRVEAEIELQNAVDTKWESLSGGALQVEIDQHESGDGGIDTNISGPSAVSDLVLKGPMTLGSGDDVEILQNGAGKFSIDVEGFGDLNSRVTSISIDPLEVLVLEVSGQSSSYRLFVPGEVSFGEMEVHFRRNSDTGELAQWWEDFASGQTVPKDVTVTTLSRDGSAARSWTFLNAVPVSYSPIGAGYGPDLVAGTESVVLRYSEVDFPEFTSDRQNIGKHFNSLIRGISTTSTISVTEVLKDGNDGRRITYLDAFPTRYVFPSLSVEGVGNLTEEVHYKALTLEVLEQ